MTEAESSRLLHEMATIGNYLIAAQDVMKSGHMPDMTGLENRIAALCESIQAAEKDVQQKCLPMLLALLENLNNCGESLKASTFAAAKEGAQ